MSRFVFQQPGADLLPVIRQYGLPFIAVAFAAFMLDNAELTTAAEKVSLAAKLVLVDDSIIRATALTINGDRVTGNGVPAGLTVDDLRQIVSHDEDAQHSEGGLNLDKTLILDLRANGRLHAQKATIANDKIKIEWRPGPSLELPIDVIRGIRVVSLGDAKDYEKSLVTPSATLDRVLIINEEGQANSISSLVESLDADTLVFDVNEVKRRVPRNKLSGIIFAQPAPSTQKPRFTVHFREGSELAGHKLSLADDKGSLAIVPQAEARFNWADVSQVSIRSTRLEYLSDWPSLQEEQTPIVTLPLSVQRDKSVLGGRLQVGNGERFEKGLGVHARSAITFAIDGKWDIFKAKIGLDDEADGQGDCIFQVLADGKSIFEERKTGHDRASEVKLPVTGCQELMLVVEPGAGLDMADHANWCDARLIKNKRP